MPVRVLLPQIPPESSKGPSVAAAGGSRPPWHRPPSLA